MTPHQFKEARKTLLLTQRELSAEWGMGANGERTIRRWEKGDLPPNPIAAYCLDLMLKRRTTSAQPAQEADMLKFKDYYAGCGRASIDGGFYLVMPLGRYRARRSNGKEWVWEGGMFDSPELAKAACQNHFLRESNQNGADTQEDE